MKIVFFETDEVQRKRFKKELRGHKLSCNEDELSEENLKKAKTAEVLVISIHSPITRAIINGISNLHHIITMSTGYDHIDLSACREKEIKVYNIPHYSEIAVAEHTFALLLALIKHIPECCEETKRGNFTLQEQKGTELYGKKLAMVGLGNIGRQVAERAKGFGMEILVVEKKKTKKLPGAKYVSLDQALKVADIISLHIPYRKETHHFLGKKEFKKMKKGALVINTSRGGLIDTEALLWALDKKRIAGAGLDVLEEEEYLRDERELLGKEASPSIYQTVLKDHVLLNYENVLVTPHNAFNTYESRDNLTKDTIQTIRDLKKRKVDNRL